MSDEKKCDREYKLPIEAAPLTDEEDKLYKGLKGTFSKRKDLASPTRIQLITHIRRFQNLGNTDEEKFNAVLNKLVAMLDLRKKYKLDNMLGRPWSDPKVSFETCCKAWPCFIYNRSAEGLPVFYDCLGGTGDIQKAMELFMGSAEAETRLTEFAFRLHENLARIKARCAKKRNLETHQLYKAVLVIDCKNIDLFTFNSIRILVQKVTTDVQILYPDTIRRIYLINTVWLFRGIWTIACLFVDAVTQAKVEILGADYLDKMVSDGIALEDIPEMFGGKCPAKPNIGGDLEFF